MKKPSAGALRLCHAVGLATRVKVGRWAPIVEVVALLPPADQAAERAVIEAAVEAGLVKMNGPLDVAHSIALTADGLEACTAAVAGADRPQRRSRRRQAR